MSKTQKTGRSAISLTGIEKLQRMAERIETADDGAIRLETYDGSLYIKQNERSGFSLLKREEMGGPTGMRRFAFDVCALHASAVFGVDEVQEQLNRGRRITDLARELNDLDIRVSDREVEQFAQQLAELKAGGQNEPQQPQLGM